MPSLIDTTRERLQHVIERDGSERLTRDVRDLVNGVCQRLRHHLSFTMRRFVPHPEAVFEQLFELQNEARAGRDVATCFRFLMRDLQQMLPEETIQQTLIGCGCPNSLALSRRLQHELADHGVSLGAARVITGDDAICKSLMGTRLEAGECARFDLPLVDGLPESSMVAVGLDNAGHRPAYACGIEIRVQVQLGDGGILTPSPIGFFGLADKIDAGRRTWLAFPGVNIASQLNVDFRGQAIDALRLIIIRH